MPINLGNTGPVPDPGAGYDSDVYGGGTFGESGHPYGTAIPFTEDYFILAEDFALKQALKNKILVADGNSAARAVDVWFGQPDPEIKPQRYPYMTIDLIDIIENRPQVQSAYGPLDDGSADYMQGLPPYDQNYGLSGYGLSPMLLVYQITSWARQPRHDRQILTSLVHSTFHPRFGQIPINADGTMRRVIVSNFAKRDTTDENQKRLFRNIWTVQIPSEVFYDPVDLTARVTSVIINNQAEARNATLANQLESVDATGPLYP